jgi:hypothetical protein
VKGLDAAAGKMVPKCGRLNKKILVFHANILLPDPWFVKVLREAIYLQSLRKSKGKDLLPQKTLPEASIYADYPKFTLYKGDSPLPRF